MTPYVNYVLATWGGPLHSKNGLFIGPQQFSNGLGPVISKIDFTEKENTFSNPTFTVYFQWGLENKLPIHLHTTQGMKKMVGGGQFSKKLTEMDLRQ